MKSLPYPHILSVITCITMLVIFSPPDWKVCDSQLRSDLAVRGYGQRAGQESAKEFRCCLCVRILPEPGLLGDCHIMDEACGLGYSLDAAYITKLFTGHGYQKHLPD